jgi:hypothetical protein
MQMELISLAFVVDDPLFQRLNLQGPKPNKVNGIQ